MTDREVDGVRTLFMGSDRFSVPIFRALLESGPALPIAIRLIGVVTQPARYGGRGRQPVQNPVRVVAEQHRIAVLQPERLREPSAVDCLRELKPDLIVVASYGQILPRTVLDIPAYGCLNLHPSLLPRFRGPSPIAGAILSGEPVTGTTLMVMVMRMDAGPIVRQVTTPITEDETGGELQARLADLSADLLLGELPAWLTGTVKPKEQNEALATYTRLLNKEDGLIDWERGSEELSRMVRAYNPWPTAYTYWNGRQVRILRASSARGAGEPGRVIGLENDAIAVGTGNGLLLVREIQLAGGKALPAVALVRGYPRLDGARLGGVHG